MEIKTIKRPWQKKTTYGNRLKKDPWYNSNEWKSTKTKHKQGFTEVNGERVSNQYCIPCWRKGKKHVPMWAVDHKQRIEDGGSRTDKDNLESQCESCHNSKSAREGNEARRKKMRI